MPSHRDSQDDDENRSDWATRHACRNWSKRIMSQRGEPMVNYNFVSGNGLAEPVNTLCSEAECA
jgi:hypothetical protein